MKKIIEISGKAVPVEGDNIDTDIIIPARFMKVVTFDSLGEYPFYDQRKKGNHPFDDERYKGASILLVNKNFGCGSSREHAPQSLKRWEIKAIVGESFAAIFESNCRMLGLPAVRVDEKTIKELMDAAKQDPQPEFRIDLQRKTISLNSSEYHFDMPESTRQAFLEGSWDITNILLSNMEKIREKEKQLPYDFSVTE